MNKKASRPFKIGTLSLPHRLIQGPLAGISCAPFRALFSGYAQPAYAVTEMISAHSMLNHHKLKKRYLAYDKKEGHWCIQLSGENPSVIYDATQIAESYGPDLIDLNCGCPKPKIRMKGCGSALMENSKQLESVVSAMRSATALPLTVKIRVGGQTNDRQYLEAARVIEACGADAIIVHGRHHSEDYDTAANYAEIKAVKEIVKIPVIANGDVANTKTMTQCFEETTADAIMVARGSIGKPWLFQSLLENKQINPEFNEVLTLFKTHIQSLGILEENDHIALLQARRLLKWYFPYLKQEALEKCYKTETLSVLIDLLLRNGKVTPDLSNNKDVYHASRTY